MTRRPIAVLAASVTASVLFMSAFPTLAQRSSAADVVNVQLLAFNDFHGNLEPPSGSNGRIGDVEAGGVEYFATHLARLKSRNPNTLIVAAGDLIGASPLLSGLFHDEPTIEAMNAMRLDVSSVGNHEFDEGWKELTRMQKGGCHPDDGCQDKTPFSGASFTYLAANVFLDSRSRDRTLFPPFAVKEIGGVKIGFIGMTLEGTPNLVAPTAIDGLTFRDEAETANRLIPELKKQHVRAIVVLIHEGGFPAAEDYNGCPGVSGAIVDIAKHMKDDIDVIVSGHTHRAYNCTLGKKLVTSAAAFGRIITTIDLSIDKTTDEIVSKSARNVIVTRDVPQASEQTVILNHYRPIYEPLAFRTVGTISQDLSRTQNTAGESPLGDVIADAFLDATRDNAGGLAVIAFINPGGIRADLTRRPGMGSDTPSPVSFSDVFNVFPFQNRLIVKTLTGDTIRRVLEQQFDNRAVGNDMVLQVSNGFSYSYDRTKPKGQRVDPASMMLNGRPIEPRQRYRVAIPDFLGEGGDNFTEFTRGDAPVLGLLDSEAFSAYLSKNPGAVPGPMNRIVRTK